MEGQVWGSVLQTTEKTVLVGRNVMVRCRHAIVSCYLSVVALLV